VPPTRGKALGKPVSRIMDETKLTARLPSLDMEVVHREDPDAGAETITIHLRATPSFDVVGRVLAANAAWWPAPMVTPMLLWSGMANAVWSAWLSAAAPGLAPLAWRPVDDPDAEA
jgi:hypothetical protein